MQNLLLPSGFRKPGLFILAFTVIATYLVSKFHYQPEFLNVKVPVLFGSVFEGKNNIIDEILCLLLISGGLFAGFSRLKNEDSVSIMKRFNSLTRSFFINMGFFAFAVIFSYDMPFVKVITYLPFTIILLYVILFHYILIRDQIKLKKYDQQTESVTG